MGLPRVSAFDVGLQRRDEVRGAGCGAPGPGGRQASKCPRPVSRPRPWPRGPGDRPGVRPPPASAAPTPSAPWGRETQGCSPGRGRRRGCSGPRGPRSPSRAAPPDLRGERVTPPRPAPSPRRPHPRQHLGRAAPAPRPPAVTTTCEDGPPGPRQTARAAGADLRNRGVSPAPAPAHSGRGTGPSVREGTADSDYPPGRGWWPFQAGTQVQ